MTMYALCEYNYDYYEWETVRVVSESTVLLIKHYKHIDTMYKLVTADEHEEISALTNNHRPHWAIREIKYLTTKE
tara:strand:- start:37500 stop:37724 length:225 start_codon:yes stop_codon:yes gene_type:complete